MENFYKDLLRTIGEDIDREDQKKDRRQPDRREHTGIHGCISSGTLAQFKNDSVGYQRKPAQTREKCDITGIHHAPGYRLEMSEKTETLHRINHELRRPGLKEPQKLNQKLLNQ